MAAKKIEDVFGKRFYFRFPCGHETEYVEYDWNNYKMPAPTRCPKCGRSADEPDDVFLDTI
jgi:hypothetical protein